MTVPMRIALDYDLTYTLSPETWDTIIEILVSTGHDVRIVTARHPEKDKILKEFSIPIIYCNGIAKKFVCHHYEEWDPDIWIDDKPDNIENNSRATREWLAEWRSTREAA